VARHHVASVTPSTRASGEMADALASGASVRKDVGVQVPPRAPILPFGNLVARNCGVCTLRRWEYGKLPAMTIDNAATVDTNPLCRWCNSTSIYKVAFGAKARWIVEVPSSNEISRLLKCEDCGLVFFSA